MGPHLTEKDVARIKKLIEEWSEPKLTWPLLVEACEKKFGIVRSRQALAKPTVLYEAFTDRKAALKAPTEKAGWIKDINEANERIEKLTEDNQRLKFVNQKLLEKFKIWQANADMYGVTQAKLNQPLVQFTKR